MSDISEEREKELLAIYAKTAWTPLPEAHPDRKEVFALCNIGSLEFDPSVGKEGSVRINTQEHEVRYCLLVEISSVTIYASHRMKFKASYEGIYNKDNMLNILKSQFVRKFNIGDYEYETIEVKVKELRNNCKVKLEFNREELHNRFSTYDYIACRLVLTNIQIRALSHRKRAVGFDEIRSIIHTIAHGNNEKIDYDLNPEADYYELRFKIISAKKFQLTEVNYMIQAFIKQCIEEYNALPEGERLA